MAESRFYAPSGWQGAGEAIQTLLEQREAKQAQQRREDIVNKREQDRIDLEWKKLLAGDADRDETRKLNEENRKYVRLQNYVGGDTPAGPADQQMADLAKTFGLSGKFYNPPEQGAYKGDDESGVPQYDVVPGVLKFRGGDKYLAREDAQAAAVQAAAVAQQERARLAAEAEQGRNERAADSNALRSEIAAGNAASHGELTGLRGDMITAQTEATKQREADREQDRQFKLEATDATEIANRQAIKDKAQRVMNVVGQLGEIDKKTYRTVTKLNAGTERLYGMPIVGRTPEFMRYGEVANADAAMKNLLGEAVVGLLNEMKNQSKTGATGMGALSGPELELLENAASMLKNPNIDSKVVMNELNNILGKAKQAYDKASSPYKPLAGRGPAGAPAPAASSDVNAAADAYIQRRRQGR